MSTTRDDLRSASDALLQDLEVLLALEEEKRDIPSDDPRLVALAARIDEIARRVTGWTSRQHALAADLHAATTSGEAAPTAIESTPARPLAAILTEWRAAQRAADAQEPGPERTEAEVRVEALRAEYRRAYDTLRALDGAADQGAEI